MSWSMSWSVLSEGTRDEVVTEATRQFDVCASASTYSTVGDPEQQDIFACKARVLGLLALMQIDESKRVRVECNGSHSWNNDKQRPLYAGFTVKVTVP